LQTPQASASATWDYCADQCIAGCQTTTYELNSLGYTNDNPNGAFYGSLHVNNIPYMQINMTTYYDIFAFLGDWGASMGKGVGAKFVEHNVATAELLLRPLDWRKRNGSRTFSNVLDCGCTRSLHGQAKGKTEGAVCPATKGMIRGSESSGVNK